MSLLWYCRIGERERGPMSFADLKAIVVTGELAETDLARREGDDEWTKAYRVVGLFHSMPPAAPRTEVRPQCAGDSPRETSAAAAERALAQAAGIQPSSFRPNPCVARLRWWQHPLDRFEIGVVLFLILWIAAWGAYFYIDSRPPVFPKPTRNAGRVVE
jgi:hypothetical protein